MMNYLSFRLPKLAFLVLFLSVYAYSMSPGYPSDKKWAIAQSAVKTSELHVTTEYLHPCEKEHLEFFLDCANEDEFLEGLEMEGFFENQQAFFVVMLKLLGRLMDNFRAAESQKNLYLEYNAQQNQFEEKLSQRPLDIISLKHVWEDIKQEYLSGFSSFSKQEQKVLFTLLISKNCYQFIKNNDFSMLVLELVSSFERNSDTNKALLMQLMFLVAITEKNLDLDLFSDYIDYENKKFQETTFMEALVVQERDGKF